MLQRKTSRAETETERERKRNENPRKEKVLLFSASENFAN